MTDTVPLNPGFLVMKRASIRFISLATKLTIFCTKTRLPLRRSITIAVPKYLAIDWTSVEKKIHQGMIVEISQATDAC